MGMTADIKVLGFDITIETDGGIKGLMDEMLEASSLGLNIERCQVCGSKLYWKPKEAQDGAFKFYEVWCDGMHYTKYGQSKVGDGLFWTGQWYYNDFTDQDNPIWGVEIDKDDWKNHSGRIPEWESNQEVKAEPSKSGQSKPEVTITKNSQQKARDAAMSAVEALTEPEPVNTAQSAGGKTINPEKWGAYAEKRSKEIEPFAGTSIMWKSLCKNIAGVEPIGLTKETYQVVDSYMVMLLDCYEMLDKDETGINLPAAVVVILDGEDLELSETLTDKDIVSGVIPKEQMDLLVKSIRQISIGKATWKNYGITVAGDEDDMFS